MKSIKGISARPNGFTLVEIIITLIAAGILGAIFINIMGTALSGSWSSVETVNNEARVVRKMEQIIAVYVETVNSNTFTPSDLETLHNNINGGSYNEPPAAPYTITVTAQYIELSSGTEQPVAAGASDTVKVTVQAGESQLATILTNCRSSGDQIVKF
jgi:prepilin-type N-terminal cleavage/methylation domain-containing protein